MWYETNFFLNELGRDGYLYRVEINGEYAGVMATIEMFEQYFYGWGMMEEFLFEKFRGNGFGKGIQRKLMEQLSANGHSGEYLFGSIAVDNISSLKTAAANGRLPFMNSYFAWQV